MAKLIVVTGVVELTNTAAASAGDLADPVVARIGNEQIASQIRRDTVRAVKVGSGGRAAVAAEAGRAGAGDGSDRPWKD